MRSKSRVNVYLLFLLILNCCSMKMGVAANLSEIAKRVSYFGDERQYKIEEVKETYDFYFHNTKTVSFFEELV